LEVMEAIRGRRAVRRFTGEKVSLEDMKKILEAGIWAPSGSNVQPWEFVLVMDEDNVERVKMLSPGLFGNPSALVVLCVNRKRAERAGKMGEESALMDVSMAAQNMMLAAYSMGIGSCPVLSFNKAALRELLDIPEHVEPVLILTFGYPKFWPKAPRRRPLEEVVHFERYGRRLE